jgi:2-haloacid dehalogenase
LESTVSKLCLQEIDAICFDVDGTLYSLDHFRVHVALRTPFDIRAWRAMERARRGLREDAKAHADVHAIIAQRMGEHLNIPAAQAAQTAHRLVHESWPRLLRKITPFSSLLVALTALKDAEVALVAASDYPSEAKLTALGLGGIPWRAALDASALGALKPRPEIYEAAVAAAGSPAERVLHVGDSSHLDVAGAQSIGMPTVLVGREAGQPSKWRAKPTWAFPSVNKFCKAVCVALVARSSS